MLAKIVGGVLVLLGLFFLRYPEGLRKRLRRKAVRKLRRYFFLAAVSLGILLIATGWKYEGFLPKALGILGVLVVLKGLLLLKSRATEEITTWLLERPTSHLRIFAAAQIALGLLILLGLTD
jgi:uncharacterized protein YjeT (DUF2065 family)